MNQNLFVTRKITYKKIYIPGKGTWTTSSSSSNSSSLDNTITCGSDNSITGESSSSSDDKSITIDPPINKEKKSWR